MSTLFDSDPDEVSAAHDAVRYVLDRIQIDPDLAYYCDRFTESFARLCAAEAARLGEPVEVVVERRSRQPEYRRREPRVVELQRRIDELERQLGDLR